MVNQPIKQVAKAPSQFSITYEIQSRLLVPLRELFAMDQTFKYNEDITQTLVGIASEYPVQTELQEDVSPSITLSGINYSLMNETIGRNLSDARTLDGVKSYSNTVNFSCIFMIKSHGQLECDHLGDTLANVLFVYYPDVFEAFGISFSNITSSNSVMTNNTIPAESYEKRISVAGSLRLNWRVLRKWEDTLLNKVQYKISIFTG